MHHPNTTTWSISCESEYCTEAFLVGFCWADDFSGDIYHIQQQQTWQLLGWFKITHQQTEGIRQMDTWMNSETHNHSFLSSSTNMTNTQKTWSFSLLFSNKTYKQNHTFLFFSLNRGQSYTCKLICNGLEWWWNMNTADILIMTAGETTIWCSRQTTNK